MRGKMRGPSQARRERDPRTTGQKPGNKKNCTRAGRVGEGGARSAVTQSEEIMEEIYQIQRPGGRTGAPDGAGTRRSATGRPRTGAPDAHSGASPRDLRDLC